MGTRVFPGIDSLLVNNEPILLFQNPTANLFFPFKINDGMNVVRVEAIGQVVTVWGNVSFPPASSVLPGATTLQGRLVFVGLTTLESIGMLRLHRGATVLSQVQFQSNGIWDNYQSILFNIVPGDNFRVTIEKHLTNPGQINLGDAYLIVTAT